MKKTETRKLSELHADPANVRTHNKRNAEAVLASLKKFGQQKPIVVNPEGVVVAGNATLAAAMELDWESLDVVVTDLKGVEATAYAIADNRTAELADWDFKGLVEQFKVLQLADIKLPDIGWEEHEFAPLMQSDFDPRMTAYGGNGDADSEAHVRTLKLTDQQRETVDKAIAALRKRENDETLGDGPSIEIICQEWLSK